MYNRELVDAIVTTYSGTDEYGQQLANADAQTRTIQVAFGILNHSQTDDVRYQNVSHYALTEDRQVTDKDTLTISGIEYKVEFVNNYGRLSEVFLRL